MWSIYAKTFQRQIAGGIIFFIAGTHPLSITLSVRKYVRSSDVTPEALVGTCLQLLQFRNYEDIIET